MAGFPTGSSGHKYTGWGQDCGKTLHKHTGAQLYLQHLISSAKPQVGGTQFSKTLAGGMLLSTTT
jgi:hypothetical protein